MVMPAWAVATLQLACAIVICASILVIGRLVDTMPHENFEFSRTRQLGDGFWWCLNGTFGTGCWSR